MKHKTVTRPKVIDTVKTEPNEWGSMRVGVNLGTLYQPTIFTRDRVPEEKYVQEEQNEPLHLALFKIRQPQILDDQTLGGIASTLSQMGQLGLSTIVVLDCEEDFSSYSRKEDPSFEITIREQAIRLQAALEDYNEPGALLIEHVLSHSDVIGTVSSTAQARGGVEVQNSNLIYPPLDNGIILVVMPFAYDKDIKKRRVQADDVLLALIREFSGIAEQAHHTDSNEALNGRPEKTFDKPILDRVIILDPVGGVPSGNRADGAHVFVNLQAEYSDIREELQNLSSASLINQSTGSALSLGISNPLSKFVEDEVAPIPGSQLEKLQPSEPIRHIKNLDVVERALKLLPPSSSGLILTPAEAAIRFKNPLLHNLLTDKPMISSSLPTSPASRLFNPTVANPPTFLKKGIPLTMIPDPRICGPWQPPSASNPSIELANDPRINLPKLIDLINDSFRRKLDPKAYLERIRGRVAGIIIAGDYEGGAICTWETPSFLLDKPPPAAAEVDGISHPDSPYWFPYLDKFAVLTSSQGSGGVSDIVWAALTRSCFPDELVWRSRTSNPVNKWYQERAKGMWNLPGGEWTMFWTTEGVGHGGVVTIGGEDVANHSSDQTGNIKWDAYVDVCSGIQPSWASSSKSR